MRVDTAPPFMAIALLAELSVAAALILDEVSEELVLLLLLASLLVSLLEDPATAIIAIASTKGFTRGYLKTFIKGVYFLNVC